MTSSEIINVDVCVRGGGGGGGKSAFGRREEDVFSFPSWKCLQSEYTLGVWQATLFELKMLAVLDSVYNPSAQQKPGRTWHTVTHAPAPRSLQQHLSLHPVHQDG